MSAAAMEAYFHELAALLDRSLRAGRGLHLPLRRRGLGLRALQPRQGAPGRHRDAALRSRLHLIDGRRHAEQCLTRLRRSRARPRARRGRAGSAAREHRRRCPRIRTSTTRPRSARSRIVRARRAAARRGNRRRACSTPRAGLDLVGIYAAGADLPRLRQLARPAQLARGRRASTRLEPLPRADKAVKTAYAGFDWARGRVRRARCAARASGSRCSAARAIARRRGATAPTSRPRRWRRSLGMLCWGGFCLTRAAQPSRAACSACRTARRRSTRGHVRREHRRRASPRLPGRRLRAARPRCR